MPMKNPALEKKIQDIEKDDKKRRSRAARFASQKHKREGDSRRQVIARMINKAKQETYVQKREMRRPTFGTGSPRDKLIRPRL